MPKIIDNVREELLKEAKRQVNEEGYAQTTICSVAKGCGIAIGTVYNYFPSKDMLIATFMMEDWSIAFSSIKKYENPNKRERIESIYKAILSFAEKYEDLFKEKEAVKAFNSSLSEKHPILISQLSSLILPVVEDKENKEFTASFIAEALLLWAMKGTEFEILYQIIEKLL